MLQLVLYVKSPLFELDFLYLLHWAFVGYLVPPVVEVGDNPLLISDDYFSYDLFNSTILSSGDFEETNCEAKFISVFLNKVMCKLNMCFYRKYNTHMRQYETLAPSRDVFGSPTSKTLLSTHRGRVLFCLFNMYPTFLFSTF